MLCSDSGLVLCSDSGLVLLIRFALLALTGFELLERIGSLNMLSMDSRLLRRVWLELVLCSDSGLVLFMGFVLLALKGFVLLGRIGFEFVLLIRFMLLALTYVVLSMDSRLVLSMDSRLVLSMDSRLVRRVRFEFMLLIRFALLALTGFVILGRIGFEFMLLIRFVLFALMRLAFVPCSTSELVSSMDTGLVPRTRFDFVLGVVSFGLELVLTNNDAAFRWVDASVEWMIHPKTAIHSMSRSKSRNILSGCDESLAMKKMLANLLPSEIEQIFRHFVFGKNFKMQICASLLGATNSNCQPNNVMNTIGPSLGSSGRIAVLLLKIWAALA